MVWAGAGLKVSGGEGLEEQSTTVRGGVSGRQRHATNGGGGRSGDAVQAGEMEGGSRAHGPLWRLAAGPGAMGPNEQ
jgi:hypothetical protein